MNFKETRSNQTVTFIEAINSKKSPNNSLYVPINIPEIYSKLTVDMNYHNVLFHTLKSFITELSDDRLYEVTNIKYEPIINKNLAQLYHTATLTHHDFATQILANLLKFSKEQLYSVSTGDNAISLLNYITNSKVIVPNKMNKCGKQLFNNFNSEKTFINCYYDDIKINNPNTDTTNIIYIIVEMATMFYSYLQLVKQEQITKDQKINIAVPVGTFSNAIACYYAKQAGLPIDKIICGENLNRPVYNIFRANRVFKQLNYQTTTTQQLDILFPKNIERLIFEIFDQDFDKTRYLMQDLDKDGKVDIQVMGSKVASNFYINYSNNIEVSKRIYSEFSKSRHLIHPITAITINAANSYQRESNDETFILIVETASPYKDYHQVCQSLGVDISDSSDFQVLYTLQKITNIDIPQQILDVCTNNLDIEAIELQSFINQ